MIAIPLSLLNAQDTDGNYSLMFKGDRCPFDTAVAVNVKQYRAETMKFDLCDSLITSLSNIVDNQEQQISTLERKALNLQILNGAYELEIERKTLVNNKLFVEYDKLNKAYANEQRWIKRNGIWFYFGAGFFIGTATTYYILK